MLSQIKPLGQKQDLLSIIKSKYKSLLDFLYHMKHLFLVKMKGNDGFAVVSLLQTPTSVSTRSHGNYIDKLYEEPGAKFLITYFINFLIIWILEDDINSDKYLVSLIENVSQNHTLMIFYRCCIFLVADYLVFI